MCQIYKKCRSLNEKHFDECTAEQAEFQHLYSPIEKLKRNAHIWTEQSVSVYFSQAIL